MQLNDNQRTAVGTACGTLVALLAGLHAEDVVKTTVMAFVGALTSFVASLILRWLTRKFPK